MATRLILVSLFSICTNQAIASVEPAKNALNGVVKGVFKNENIPVEGIKLALQGSDRNTREAVTSRNGSFQWTGLDRGIYWLSIQLPGKQNSQKVKVDLSSEDVVSLSFSMRSNRSDNSEVVLSFEAP
jgi:hypothetical protein